MARQLGQRFASQVDSDAAASLDLRCKLKERGNHEQSTGRAGSPDDVYAFHYGSVTSIRFSRLPSILLILHRLTVSPNSKKRCVDHESKRIMVDSAFG